MKILKKFGFYIGLAVAFLTSVCALPFAFLNDLGQELINICVDEDE